MFNLKQVAAEQIESQLNRLAARIGAKRAKASLGMLKPDWAGDAAFDQGELKREHTLKAEQGFSREHRTGKLNHRREALL